MMGRDLRARARLSVRAEQRTKDLWADPIFVYGQTPILVIIQNLLNPLALQIRMPARRGLLASMFLVAGANLGGAQGRRGPPKGGRIS